MNRKVKRSQRLTPTWVDPLAPTRNSCAKMSDYDSEPTLCHRLPSRFGSTIAPKTPTTPARASLAPDKHPRPLDRIPKDEPTSQAAEFNEFYTHRAEPGRALTKVTARLRCP